MMNIIKEFIKTATEKLKQSQRFEMFIEISIIFLLLLSMTIIYIQRHELNDKENDIERLHFVIDSTVSTNYGRLKDYHEGAIRERGLLNNKIDSALKNQSKILKGK